MTSSPPKVWDGDILTVSAVSMLLGVHINTVKRIDPTDLPYFTIGSRRDRRYRRADVEAYIRHREHRGT